MDALRGHRKRHIMDGFPSAQVAFATAAIFSSILFDAHLRERHRQADALAEAQHRFNLVHRAVLQHQLRRGTEGHFLTVIQVMALFKNGETVVDCMGSGRPLLSKPMPLR